MVAVDYPDPPSEAKIKPEYMAVPSSALPSNALAAAASAWGETSTDELPDDNEETYGEAEGPAYAYARAEANFRRFATKMHTIMAVRFMNRPRNTEEVPAPNTDRSTVVPELAHKPMDAPHPYEVGSDVYVNPSASAPAYEGATERSARSSASVASTADDVRVIMLRQELQLNQLRAQMELQAARFQEEIKRKDMQSAFDVRQANLLAQAEKQAEVAAARLLAAQQIQDHMQNSDLASMQAIADRLDRPREPRRPGRASRDSPSSTSGTRARSCPSRRSPTASSDTSSSTTAGPTSTCTTSSTAASNGCGSAHLSPLRRLPHKAAR